MHKYIISLLSFLIFSGISCSQFNPSQHAKQQAIDQSIKTGFEVLGTQINEELTYHRTKNRQLTPLQESQQRLSELQEKQAKVAIEYHDLEKELTQLKIKEAKYDVLTKEAQAFQVVASSLKRDDQYAAKTPQRLKQKLMELNGDSPESQETTVTETQKTDASLENKKMDDIKAKQSLFTVISVPCVIAATKIGNCADFLAGHSFGYITALNCFKETFIGKHATTINRTLVATTLATMTYAAYKLYKAKTYVDNDDDIFNDDDY